MTRPETLHHLAEAHRLDEAGQQGQALFAYKRLLRLDPDCREAKIDLAGLLSTLGRHAEARELCREALQTGPEDPRAQLNLAGALLGLGDHSGADALYRQLLESTPSFAAWALLGLGTSLDAQGRLAEAQAVLEQLLLSNPDHRQAREVLLRVLLQRQDWSRVREHWTEIALRHLDPFESRLEQAVVHLLFGDFERGWPLMEGRLDRPGFTTPIRAYTQPRWEGQPFEGRTLLLHFEQGFGDTFMFIRYAALAKARGGRVIALVPRPQVALIRTVPGIDAVLGPEEALPPFDLQAPIFSLPQILGTRLETLPAAIPYLQAPTQGSPALERLLNQGCGLQVGLVWAGSPVHRDDARRSIPLPELARLSQAPGVSWHSLQVGWEADLPFHPMADLGPLLTDFSQTARALESLDLVITVDTAVAHLAGALGRPTWLLLPFIPDWRWMLAREDSPWYPTLRLFRQEKPQAWGEVLERILAALLEGLRGTC